MFNDDNYKAISVLSTEYDSGISTEYTSSIKANRSLVALILLSVATCGLYPLYFFSMCGRDLNLIAMNDGRKTASFYLVFLCSFLLLAVVGTYPIYYYIINGGEIPFITDPGLAKTVMFAVMLGMLAVFLVPQLLWFHNFSLRIDNELQKRKTDYRLPLAVFWVFACILPVGFDIFCMIIYLVRDIIDIQWLTLSVCIFCIVASCVSMIIYLGFVIFTMNTLSQCAIYRNVEYR